MWSQISAALCLGIQWSQRGKWFHCGISFISPKARGVSANLYHSCPPVMTVLVVCPFVSPTIRARADLHMNGNILFWLFMSTPLDGYFQVYTRNLTGKQPRNFLWAFMLPSGWTLTFLDYSIEFSPSVPPPGQNVQDSLWAKKKYDKCMIKW